MPPTWIRPSPSPFPRRCASALRLVAAQPGEDVVHELGAFVRPEALDSATDVGQELLRRRRHAGHALSLKGVEPASARRVIREQDQG